MDCVNTIRFLAIDAINKSNSGHPGLPMGCAPMGYVIYREAMTHNPKDHTWFNRDRFVSPRATAACSSTPSCTSPATRPSP